MQQSANPQRSERYRGRISQTFIYLGKLLRMFVYQNDWKVLPMAAVIAGLVSFVLGANLFKTQEGTMSGCFALVCVCIWNGFFNSIQVVCRERSIVKREHRAGLHISSYIAAHMIYQLLLCLMQTGITIVVLKSAGVKFPEKSLVFPNFETDLAVSLFLITYAADMTSLMVSCVVKNTTTAMTVMPFLLIVQLVFSGHFFQLEGAAQALTIFTITRWGTQCLCTLGNFNALPMVALWNMIHRFKDVDMEGYTPILGLLQYMEEEDQKEAFLAWAGQNNQNPNFNFVPETLLQCWGVLILFSLAFALVGMLFLEYVDRDRR